MDGVGQCGRRAGGEHDDCSGDGVSGERAGWLGDPVSELARVYDGEWPVGGCGQHDGDDCAGWIYQCESGAEPGGDAGGALLHGGLPLERRDDDDAVLGGSGGGAGKPGAGAGAVDAGGAGGAGGEQVVCGPGDGRAGRKPADGQRREPDGAALFEQ